MYKLLTTISMTAPVGAHASALMALREKSLQAYGIDPKALIIPQQSSLLLAPENITQSLAKAKNEERALAVQSEHHLMVIV